MAPPGKGAALASAKRTHPQAQIEAGQALPQRANRRAVSADRTATAPTSDQRLRGETPRREIVNAILCLDRAGAPGGFCPSASRRGKRSTGTGSAGTPTAPPTGSTTRCATPRDGNRWPRRGSSTPSRYAPRTPSPLLSAGTTPESAPVGPSATSLWAPRAAAGRAGVTAASAEERDGWAPGAGAAAVGPCPVWRWSSSSPKAATPGASCTGPAAC